MASDLDVRLSVVKSDGSIGARLRAWRDALGLTQQEMASRLGLHIGVLKKYESGHNTPGGEALAAVARTGVNMTWLLTGEGEMLAAHSGAALAERQNGDAHVGLGPDHPRAKRWAHLVKLVEQIEDDARRDAILGELFARAQEVAEIDELRRAVRDLRAARKAG